MKKEIESIKGRYAEIAALMVDETVLRDEVRLTALSKEYKQLTPIMEAVKEYEDVAARLKTSSNFLRAEKDEGLRAMAREEIDALTDALAAVEARLKELLIPLDADEEKNVILEIRAGTGGQEAALFAGDLFRMYARYCEANKWRCELLTSTEGIAGGYKEVIANIIGRGAYGKLRYESGVHRVQRVPSTEAQGRVHTSAASVAVLPEQAEVAIHIDKNDIRKDTYCSSGPGGQSVNTTYSAVRLTHIPTGLVVTCQDEKSQLKNYDKALKVLRIRLHQEAFKQQQAETSSQRRSMVGSGDRSDKIRTYNYPQARITDHRIALTLYALSSVLDGHLDVLIEPLRMAARADKLKAQP